MSSMKKNQELLDLDLYEILKISIEASNNEVCYLYEWNGMI